MVTALVRPDSSRGPSRVWPDAPPPHGRPRTLPGRVAALLVASLEQYRLACHRFVRQNPWLPVASFALTVLIYLNKFGLAWLVMRGLGVERDFALTVALMALVHFCVFLAPSPGGSGIAEVATGAFVSILLPGSLVGPFTLVYRAADRVRPAAAGAVLLLAELRPRRRRETIPGERRHATDRAADGHQAPLAVAAARPPGAPPGGRHRRGLLRPAPPTSPARSAAPGPRRPPPSSAPRSTPLRRPSPSATEPS